MRTSLLIAAIFVTSLSAAPLMAQQGSGLTIVNGRSGTIATIAAFSVTPVGGATSSGTFDPMNVVIDVGNVAAPSSHNYIGATVTLALRSVMPYILSAQVVTGGFTVGVGEIAPSDIGIGIDNLRCTGGFLGGCNPGVPGATNINPPFDNDPFTATKDANGKPNFAASIADLSLVPVQLMDGPRISWRGRHYSPNNTLLADMHFAIGPQTWRENAGFMAAVIFTIGGAP